MSTKIHVLLPLPLVRVWLTPPPTCLHLALDTALWSGSVIAGGLKIWCSLVG